VRLKILSGIVTTRMKIIRCVVAILVVFAMVYGLQALRSSLKGIDASNEDPTELFKWYVQNPISEDILVQSAVGHANFGGTCITFRLSISNKAVDSLIGSKNLRKAQSVQQNLFPEGQLATMTQPDFYSTHEDTTWSDIGTTAMMAVDRNADTALYLVFSP
jgi:hypothetical protein